MKERVPLVSEMALISLPLLNLKELIVNYSAFLKKVNIYNLSEIEAISAIKGIWY